MAGALRLGTFSPSVVLRVARSVGVLGRYDLTVVEEPVPSSTAQFRALLDGSLDAALTSPDNVLRHWSGQVDRAGGSGAVRILLGVDRGLGLALYGRPGTSTVDAVRGGVVGVDVADSGFAFVLYEILAAAGLRRGADYTVVELGATPRRADALLAGDCTATLLNAGSDLRAEAHGCHRLRRAVDACRPYLGTVLAATGEACDRDADRLAALVAALRAVLPALAAPALAAPAPVDRAAAVGPAAARDPGGAVVDRDVAGAAAVAAAQAALRLSPADARRYVDRLADPDEGLIGSGQPDEAALRTVLELRRRHAAGPDQTAPAGPARRLLAVPPGLVDLRFLAGPATR